MAKSPLEEIEGLKQEYVNLLAEIRSYEDKADRSATRYTELLEDFESQHPEVVNKKRQDESDLKQCRERAEQVKEQMRLHMEEHFEATGQKFILGDALTIQERLDWEYDETELVKQTLIQAFAHALLQSGYAVINKETEEVVDFPSEVVERAIMFAEDILKLSANKTALRKFISSHIDKAKNAEGDIVLEVPEGLEWLPLDFYVKVVTVISDKKLESE